MVREPDVTVATLLKLCGSVVAPTQYSCLENPMDGVAWWAAVHAVAQSRTQLKQLSSSSSSIMELAKWTINLSLMYLVSL